MELAFSWAFVSAGAVAIVWLKLHYGRKQQAPQAKELQGQCDALHSDLQSVYDELSDKLEQVNERMDFAERLLSRPRSADEDAELESAPEAVTPV